MQAALVSAEIHVLHAMVRPRNRTACHQIRPSAPAVVLTCTLLKRLCQFGVVVIGGGFAASLDEFFKAWGNLFPDVVRSKSRRQCETNPTGIAVN